MGALLVACFNITELVYTSLQCHALAWPCEARHGIAAARQTRNVVQTPGIEYSGDKSIAKS